MPDKFHEATLTHVTDTTFTIKAGRDLFHYSLQSVISVAQPNGGLRLGPLLERMKTEVAIAITVNHLVIYKGAFGLSFSG